MLSIFLKAFYTLRGKPVPYYAEYSLLYLAWKPIRKFANVVIIPNIPFNYLRILGYRLIGFKIGKHVFIRHALRYGRHVPGNTTIEDNVLISYGCYFAIHGPGQKHTCIRICEGAYVGMAATMIPGKDGVTLGKDCVIGAGALVNSRCRRAAGRWRSCQDH